MFYFSILMLGDFVVMLDGSYVKWLFMLKFNALIVHKVKSSMSNKIRATRR